MFISKKELESILSRIGLLEERKDLTLRINNLIRENDGLKERLKYLEQYLGIELVSIPTKTQYKKIG